MQQQKDNRTFVVVDAATGTFKAECKFVNSATPVAGQMSLQATTNAATYFYVSRLTNKWCWDYTARAATGTGNDTNQVGVKYRWNIPTIVADYTLLDNPSYLHVSLPSAVKASSTNLAP